MGDINREVDVKDKSLSNEDLIALYRGGVEEAKDELCMRNFGLIHFVINKYGYNYYAKSMTEDDLVQEGFLGLMKAVDMYDQEIGKDKGCLFSTYALYWIRQSIAWSLCNDDDIVRIPVHMRAKFMKARRIWADKEFSKYEMGENSEPCNDKVRAEALREADMSEADFNSICNVISPASLNLAVSTDEGDGDTELGDYIPNGDPSVEDTAIRSLDYEDIMRLFASANLDERERFVLTKRYGLGGSRYIWSLRMLADKLGVTRERVRQIQLKAEKKIHDSVEGRLYTSSLGLEKKEAVDSSPHKCAYA